MNDEKLMKRTFELAKKGEGKVLTNPMVGAVIVKNNKIIGEGYHHNYGNLHAERDAFNNLTEDAKGASLYVNLEPCSHQGKQPPCVDEVIRQGISKVYISNIDTNPKVDGIKKLKDHGIEVYTGLLEEEGKKLNEVFFYNMKYNRPFISLKYAMTLDGKIACANGDSKWISNEKSREHVHKLRSKYDAIIVGKTTAIHDNPSLNSRIEAGIDPVRIIIDSKLELPEDLKVFDLESDKKTYVATCSDKENPYKVDLIRCKDKNGQVDINDLLDKLYAMNIGSVLVEGGSHINNTFLEADLVDRIYEFISPKIISGERTLSPFTGKGCEFMSDAYNFEIEDINRFDTDILIEAKNVHWNI